MDETLSPTVCGMSLRAYLMGLWGAERSEVPRHWRAGSLRVCPLCIALGVHLRVHQHLAFAQCPVHDEVLICTCTACGASLPDAYPSFGVKAFSCGACRGSFLPGDAIALWHKPSFQERVAQKVEAARTWLSPNYLDTAFHPWNADKTMGQGVFLEAMRQSSAAPPSWLSLAGTGGFRSRIVSVDLATCRLDAAAYRAGPAVFNTWREYEAGGSWQGPKLFVTPDAYRCALRRVTSAFLSRRAHHTTCLDHPRLVACFIEKGEGFDTVIRRCCPVALGFWLWRRASSAQCLWLEEWQHSTAAADETLRLPPEMQQRLLHLSARSYLHYCIHVARGFTQTPPSARAKNLLRALGDGPALWSALSDQPGRFAWDGLRAYVTSFDATHAIKQTACAGHRALKQALIPLLGKRFARTLLERHRQDIPYLPLMNEWHLTPPGLMKTAYGDSWRYREGIFRQSYEDDRAILDRTITRRGEEDALS